MPFIHSSYHSIGTCAVLFGALINAQALYGNVSTYSNTLGALDLPSSGMPAIVDAVTIMLQEPPPPTPAPGQTMPSALPPTTAAPSPIETDALDKPHASADSAAPAQTDGGGGNDCSRCSIYFKYVNVYYWPAASSNTDCLSIVTSKTPPPIPSGYAIVSPSIYVVFPAISAGNACTQVGGNYSDFVTSFAPGELSTIEGPGGPTKSFDFADLPCPPTAVAAANSLFYNPLANPERAYSPMIDLPRGVLEMDPAFSNCVAAIYQGFDPPIALQPTDQVTPAQINQFGLHSHNRPAANPHKRAAAHPHMMPRPSN